MKINLSNKLFILHFFLGIWNFEFREWDTLMPPLNPPLPPLTRLSGDSLRLWGKFKKREGKRGGF